MGASKPSPMQIDSLQPDGSREDHRRALLEDTPQQDLKAGWFAKIERRWLLYTLLSSAIIVVLAWTLFSSSTESWGPNMTCINATAQIDAYGNTWLESTVELNGITVYYYHNEQLSSVPNFIFFHGGGSSGTEGIEIFSSIAKNYRMFFPSARGSGKTSRVAPYGTAQMVEDAEALIPLLINTKEDKIFVAGHSMGATIAPRIAKLHSEYVAKLILEDPGWLRREGEDPSMNRPGYQPRGGDDLSNESVENIVVPTLILTAEFGDGVPEVLDTALETYPQGSKHYFEGASHCIHCDFSDDYLKVVSEYFGA